MPDTDDDKDTSVLVLHDEGLDPRPFLSRLTGTEAGSDDVSWQIDNKYYTANVTLESRHLDAPIPSSYPALVYLFSGEAPNPLPASLTRLAVRDPPPDISIAVRVGDAGVGDVRGPLDDERFDEIGLEVVDELGHADEDDERPLDPLETVRQTLMTHMWPNMKRKTATAGGRNAPRPEITVNGAELSDEEGEERAAFPVLFANHTGPPPPRRTASASAFPTPEPRDDASDASGDEVPRGGAYTQMEEAGEFGEFAAPTAEFARLEAWLDDDGDDLAALAQLRAFADGAGGMSAQALSTRDLEHFGLHDTTNGTAANGHSRAANENAFEDDFGPSAEPNIPLDPTPLLLHLQNVRAELADIEDEDERRVRAAREVAQLMGQLGFGDEELGLDELEFDDDLGPP